MNFIIFFFFKNLKTMLHGFFVITTTLLLSWLIIFFSITKLNILFAIAPYDTRCVLWFIKYDIPLNDAENSRMFFIKHAKFHT